MAFQYPGFQQPGFQTGEALPVGGSQVARSEKIPRWLLSFERMGKLIFLSDVGGEVQGQFYIPAIVDVNHSDLTIDIERFTITKPSCNVTVSPSSLKEHFIEPMELGQAKVTVSSWDGYVIRPVIHANMADLQMGYDGENTTFSLLEDFDYNPIFPEGMVNFDTFARADLVDGARFRAYTQAWGDAVQVPAFAVINLSEETQRWMIVGHNVPHLPTGGSGTPARFKDLLNGTFIGADLGDPVGPYYTFNDSYNLSTAGELLRVLIEKHSTYPVTLVDDTQIQLVYRYLNRFPVGGFVDQESPIFDLITSRFQREFLFVIYQQGGMLRGAAIDPTAPVVKTKVLNKHLLQLQDQVTEDKRYTHFKVRYQYRSKPPNPGWYGVKDVGANNDEYYKQAELRWGKNPFGDPVEFKRHAPSVDLADIEQDAAAVSIRDHYSKLHHRGTRFKYLELADGADTPLGSMVALVDEVRGLDNKRAILLGRQWLTPELVVNTYRTIEPFTFEREGPPPATGGLRLIIFEPWETYAELVHLIVFEPWETIPPTTVPTTLIVSEPWES